jgi:hypothetical protein
MENLTPIQRIAVIVIGLALTAIIAALLLPWMNKQIQDRLPPTSTPLPPTPTKRPASTTPTPRVMHLTPQPIAFLPSLTAHP